MKGSRSLRRILLVLPLLLFFASALSPVAVAQGLPESLSHGNPSNDCGCPRGDDAIPVSSGMLSPFLPKIPNLELGFLYSFGKNVRTGRFTADYLLPFKLSADSVLFGEAHAEGWDFWKKPSVSASPPVTVTASATSNRIDLSFGGGYRTMLGTGSLLGANGFYDSSRIFNKWYSSGGLGLEMAAIVGGDDAVDVNVNWYGNLFNRDVLVNAFRNKGNSFDVEAGYSHALFDHALDLRLKVAGYQFDVGNNVSGWRGGADLTTRDGMFTLRYEHGQDRINGDYNTVGGFVTVGFQLENLLNGGSPFTLPTPVFRSPRDLRRLLGLKVKRNWHEPEAVVLSSCPNLRGTMWMATTIMPWDLLEPAVPPIPLNPGTVTICWCRATTLVTNVHFLFMTSPDGTDTDSYYSDPITITIGSGCMTTGMSFAGGQDNINGVLYGKYFGGQPPLEFDQGGGVSFSFP